MSDFLTELRAEVLDAHAAQRRRGRAQWLPRPPAFGRRPALVAATAAVALVLAVLALRAGEPPPTSSPRVVDVIRIGGDPTAAVADGRSVWVADLTGRQLVQLDSTGRKVVARARFRGQPIALAAGAGGAWVRTAVDKGGTVERVEGTRTAKVGFGTSLAVGATRVWAADVELAPEGIHRIDAATARDLDLVAIPGVYTLAVVGEALWAVTGNGTVLRLDERTGRLRARWPAVALSPGTAPPAIAADARGAWVLRTAQGADSQAIRLEGDRVARRLPIDPSVLPLIAQAPDGLWVVTSDAARGRSAVLRLDPETGAVTARVGLGRRNVTALVPVGAELWVVAGDGTVSIVAR
jgi:hypothetical protein